MKDRIKVVQDGDRLYYVNLSKFERALEDAKRKHREKVVRDRRKRRAKRMARRIEKPKKDFKEFWFATEGI